MVLLDTLPYAAPAAYLLIVTAFLVALGRCPHWVHPVAVVGGVAAHGVVLGWGAALTALGAGAVVLVFLVFAAARLLSATGLFTIAAAVAIAPTGGWVGMGAGLLLAAIVGTVRTIQVAGVDRVRLNAASTTMAMGLTPGGFARPNPDLLPQAADTEQIVTTERDARRMRLFLAPYLLVGVLLAATVAAVF